MKLNPEVALDLYESSRTSADEQYSIADKASNELMDLVRRELGTIKWIDNMEKVIELLVKLQLNSYWAGRDSLRAQQYEDDAFTMRDCLTCDKRTRHFKDQCYVCKVDMSKEAVA